MEESTATFCDTDSISGESPLLDRLIASGKVGPLLKGIGFFLKNYETGVCIPNSFWLDLGWTAEQMQNEHWKDFIHPDDRPVVDTIEKDLVTGLSDSWVGEYRIQDAEGAWHHVQHKALVLERGKNGRPTLYVGWDFEISNYIQRIETAKEASQKQEQRYLRSEAIRSAGAILSAELDPVQAAERILSQARVVVSFSAAAAWVRRGEENIRLATLGPVDTLPAIRHLSVSDLSKRAEEQRVPRISVDSYGLYASRLELPLVHRNIVIGYLEFYSSDATAYGNEETGAALIFAEQASVAFFNALRYSQSEQEAATDWLTALPTRRAFLSRSTRFLAELPAETSLGVLMIDIDHFKQVNDVWGHLVGDEALVAVAKACREVLRAQDIYCRYGGEEIVAILPFATEKESTAVAERLRKRVMEIKLTDTPDLRLSISVGVTTGKGRDEFKPLLTRADEALYLAKNRGRNRCELR